MKKIAVKNKKASPFNPKITDKNKKEIFSEKNFETVPLREDISDDFREGDELGAHKKNMTNWSAPEDRGEDLINEIDPFIQQPERDTQIPPELIQEHAYRLYEQRGGNHGDNLADWFEAERRVRGEVSSRKKIGRR